MRILGAPSVQSSCTLLISASYSVFVYGRYRKSIFLCVVVAPGFVVVVVYLPRPMEGMGIIQFSDLFTELTYPPLVGGVVWSQMLDACGVLPQSAQTLSCGVVDV